jgi:predicted nucleic acid-binding Zn ribbon protein
MRTKPRITCDICGRDISRDFARATFTRKSIGYIHDGWKVRAKLDLCERCSGDVERFINERRETIGNRD